MENTSPLILLRWHSNNDNYDFSHSRLLVGWFLLGNLHFLIWLKFPAFALKFFLGKVAVGCLLITGLATVGLLRWNKEMLCAYICTSVHALFLYCFILVSWMLLNFIITICVYICIWFHWGGRQRTMCIGCGCPTHPTSSAITTGWRRTSLRTSGFNANIAITTLIFAITTTRFNSVILSTDHDVLTPKALQHLAELHHKVKQFPKCPPKYPLKIASFSDKRCKRQLDHLDWGKGWLSHLPTIFGGWAILQLWNIFQFATLIRTSSCIKLYVLILLCAIDFDIQFWFTWSKLKI